MKIVFLDRDGVINQFPGTGNYVTKVKDFHFIPGSLDAIKILTDQDYYIFVVSNQAGVGKKIYSQKKLDLITRKMLAGIRSCGGRIKKVFYCVHPSSMGCNCRKPEIGSIEKAMEILKTSLRSAQHAYFVGDTESDILTGHNAGCKTIFVLSGHETRRNVRGWKVQPDHITKNLQEAVAIITDHHARLKKNKL